MDSYTEKVYLLTEHAHSWTEVRDGLYELFKDPNFHDVEMYKWIADTIDEQLRGRDKLRSMNDLMPAVVQTMYGLRSMYKYADGVDLDDLLDFVHDLVDACGN